MAKSGQVSRGKSAARGKTGAQELQLQIVAADQEGSSKNGPYLAVVTRPGGAPLALGSATLWIVYNGEPLELPVSFHEKKVSRSGLVTLEGAVAAGSGAGQIAFDLVLELKKDAENPWTGATAHLTSRCRQPIECALELPFVTAAPEVPRWLVPGFFYGDNGLDPSNVRVFPRFSPEPDGVDPFISSWWAFRSDRCASAVVFAGIGPEVFFVAADEHFSHGMSGLGFEYASLAGEEDLSGDLHAATLSLFFPWREAPVSYAEYKPHHLEGEVSYVELQPGETMTCGFRFGVAPDEDRYGFAPILRGLYNLSRATSHPNPWMGTPEAAELGAYGNFAWFYDPTERVLVETCAFDRYFPRGQGLPGYFDRTNMHVSWNSGIAYAHALARWGEVNGFPEYLDAGNAVIDRICREALAPCGAFWGQFNRAKEGGPGWDGGWNPDPQWLHARTPAEACTFLCDAIAWEESRGRNRPRWRKALASCLDYAVKVQREDGGLGTYYHAITGEVMEWKGTGALAWIPALIRGARLLDPAAGARGRGGRYLKAAVAAGRFYMSHVEAVTFFGGCEDVSLSPSSEDGYNALLAYAALYEATGEEEFLLAARRSAEWMLTFRWSYNVRFDEHTLLGRYDYRTVGGDVASPPNQHLHNYGLIATEALLRLWMWTGDRYYYDRARDHIHYSLQMIAREDGDMSARRGMMSEQYYHTDWWQPKGCMLQLAHVWCAGFLTIVHHVLSDLEATVPPRFRADLRRLQPPLVT